MFKAHFNFRHFLTLLAIVSFWVVLLPVFTKNAYAANGVPRTINFQGRVVNNTTGINIANGTVKMIFSLYNGASGGTALWTETQNSVPVTDGIFRAVLGGGGTPIPTSVNFNWDGLYLGVAVGTDSEMTPRIQLASVPFAFNAQQVAGLTVQDTSGNASTSGTLQVANGVTVRLPTSGTGLIYADTGSTGTLATLSNSTTQTGSVVGLNLSLSGATSNYNQYGFQFNLSGSTSGNQYDILGSGSSWYVTSAGSLHVASCVGCGGGGGPSFWQELTGALSSLNSGDDLLLGSSSTASAKFAFTGLMGNQTQASFSGQFVVMPNNGYGGQTAIGYTNPGTATLAVNGNVGIGTTNPQENLSIGDGTKDTSLSLATSTGNKLYYTTYQNTGYTSINRRSSDGVFANTGLGASSIGWISDSTGGYIDFNTAAAANTNPTGRMRITEAGNFIPLADNSYSLGASPSSRFKSLFLGSGSLHIQCLTTDAGCPASQNLDYSFSINSAGTLSIGANVGGVIPADIFLTQGGNVGIGTTSPTALLHINGGYSNNAALIINNLNSGDLFTASASGTTKFTIGNTGALTDAAYGTNGGVLYTNGANGSIAQTATGTSGYVLQSNGGGAPTWISPTGLSAGSVPFSGITSGTNTVAAMVVGTGASLTYSGGTATSGVINANQLLGGTWAIPGTIGSTTPNTGAFTTLTASNTGAGALDVAGGIYAGTSNAFQVDTSGNISSSGTTGITLSGAGADLNFTGTGPNQITTASGVNLALMPGGTGNVGIGTTAPGAKLEVLSTTQQLKLSYDSSNYAGLSAGSNGMLNISTKGINNLIIASDPNYAGYTNIYAGTIASPDSSNYGWEMKDDGSEVWFNVAPTGLQLISFGTANGTTLVVTEDKVGIGGGYAVPANTLSVTGTANFTGNVGIGDTTPVSLLTVGNGDLFQVDSTGKIVAATGITSSGTITLSGLNGNNAVVYGTTSTGLLATAITNTSGQCLLSGGSAGYTPNWGTCPSGGSGGSNWRYNLGAISPINDTVDLLIGNNASSSAKFGFINVNSGTPAIQISGTTVLTGLTLGSGVTGSSLTSVGILTGLVSTGTVTLGGATGTETLTLGQSTQSQTINIAGAQVADTKTVTIHLGDSATGTGKDIITMGNTNGASSLGLSAGSGGITLTNTTTTVTKFASSTTNSDTIEIKPQSTGTGATINGIITSADLTTADKTWTFPNASGTVAVSASGTIGLDSAGNITCSTCVVSGGTLFTLAATTGSNSTIAQGGTITLAAGTGITTTNNAAGQITIAGVNAAADGSTKGIAAFNSTNFSASTGVVNTIQNIATASTPQFAGLGIGVAYSSYPLDVISTAVNQLRIGYNTSNYFTGAVSSAGAVTFTATGASAGFNFANALSLGTSGSANGSLTLYSSGGATAPSISADSSKNLNITAPSGQVVLSGTGNINIDPSANNLIANLSSTGDFLIQDAGATFATFSHLGQFSLSGAVTGNALAIFNTTGDQDVFTASVSGATKFRIANTGAAYVSLSGTQTGYALCHTTNGQSTNDQVVDCTGTLSDYAERYPVKDDVNFGDVVTMSSEYKFDKSGTEVPVMEKSSIPYGDAIGIVSDNYSDFSSIGDNYDGSIRVLPIALVGRVPVKVSLENGPIKQGDYLTVSSTPGVAMKATKAGYVLGKAMVDYDGSTGNTVLVFVKTTWYQPNASVIFTDVSNLHVQFVQADNATISGTLNVGRIIAGKIDGLDVLDNRVTNLETQMASVLSAATGSAEFTAAAGNLPPALTLDSLNVGGLATVSGDLNVGGNSFIQGALNVLSNITTKNLLVSDFAYFINDVVFKGNVRFNSTPTFNNDTAGFAVIKQGSDTVSINFNQEYVKIPVVTASIALEQTGDSVSQKALEDEIFNSNIAYVITQRTTKGFVIRLNKPAPEDINFSWVALSVQNAQTSGINSPTPTPDPSATQSAAFQSILDQLNSTPTPSP
jgi:hypothetical protein